METAAAQSSQPSPANPVSGDESERRGGASASAARQSQFTGYGLPCSKCRLYYPGDMDRCPICKSSERISPGAPVATSTPQPQRNPDEERERLRELKSQVYASHTQISTATTFRCALDQNHLGNVEPAAVCHSCYGELRQQADRMEAALHMDVKEAAQIVYAAVWADTSDPTRTYQNAAAALLAELRQRAGIGLLLSQRNLAH